MSSATSATYSKQASQPGRLARLWRLLPEGRLLPEEVWHRRHKVILWLLWFHVAGFGIISLFLGWQLSHIMLEVGIPGSLAALASWGRLGRSIRSAVASVGLITCSAIVVHMSGGVIEAHFHFFVMIPILALYQDWLPYLIAIGYVGLHHGGFGVAEPHLVYNHPDAIAHPWKWAGIHAGFVFAASLASLTTWRAGEQMMRDGLTALPTRLVFTDRVRAALQHSGRRQRKAAVICLDIDRLKVINDSLGHEVGDRLIQELAVRLKRATRAGDVLSRSGGGEFFVLSPGIQSAVKATAIARRIRQNTSGPIQVSGHQVYVTVSIGIGLTGRETDQAEDLMRDADSAMYKAKALGGDRFVVFDRATRPSVVERLEQENALRTACDKKEFRIFYQPEKSLKTGEIVGVEALLRWQRPGHGLVFPKDFIGLAEQTGMIVRIGEWVLEEACRQIVEWEKSGTPTVIRVNLSGRQFAEVSLARTVARILKATGADPARLCLEITESVLMEDTAATMSILKGLRKLGVRLAIDDFGTVYSSLSYLKRFPLDNLKIDRSFVTGVATKAEDAAIIAATISMAHALGLVVTAEGVETKQQLEKLRKLGCDNVQGHWFYPALPVEKLESLRELSMIRKVVQAKVRAT